MTLQLDEPNSVNFQVHGSRSQGFEKVDISFVFPICNVTNKFRNIQTSPDHKAANEKSAVKQPRKGYKDEVHYGCSIFFKQKTLNQGVLPALQELA